MKDGTWRASPLALASALVIAAAAILGFVLARHSVEGQNQALLKDDSAQAAGYVSSLVSSLGSTLDALAPGVTSSRGSPLAFEAQAQPLASEPVTLLLASDVDGHFEARAVAGSGFTTGQVLDPQLSATLARGVERDRRAC